MERWAKDQKLLKGLLVLFLKAPEDVTPEHQHERKEIAEKCPQVEQRKEA
jgi:hypothetical protein